MKRYYIIIPIGILAFSLNYFTNNLDLSSDISDVYICEYQTDDKECSFCHNDKIKHEFLHGNVAEDCETCHQSTGNKHPRAALKGFTLAEQPPELCYVCHEQKNTKSHLHAPVEYGECNSCHDPHGAEYKYLLSKDPVPSLCNDCHDIDLSAKMNIHAALELDGCQSCHDSHQSDYDFLLTDEKKSLCFVCHDAESELMKLQYKHVPFEDDCANCHNPHSSKFDHLLSTSSDELCFTCHDDISQAIKESKYVHKVAENGKNCQNCHSPHASSNPRLLSEKQEILCFSCHNKEIQSENKLIENIDKTIKESKFKHSAMEMGGCELCHNPHASNNVSLLNGAFPEGEYAPANSASFELCFTCHDIEMIESEVTETATNFRNGNKNLHYIHIKGNKGRNCNICHDMHASDNKLLIKRRTKFGSWDMPLNFKQIPDGASCRTGCHKEEAYNRVEAVIYTGHNLNSRDTSRVAVDETDPDVAKEDTTKVVTDVIEQDVVKEDTTKAVTDIIEQDVVKEDTTKAVTDIIDPDVVNEDTTKVVTDVIEPDVVNKDTTKVVTDVIEPDVLKGDTTKVIVDVTDPDPVKEDTIKQVINGSKPSVKDAFEDIMPMKILFIYGKDDLENNIDDDLEKLVKFLNQYPEAVIEIGGHTDYIGSISYNIDLSRKRAQAIKRLLNSKGILPHRLEIKAYGESFPVDTNTTEEGRQNNRRVEFKLIDE